MIEKLNLDRELDHYKYAVKINEIIDELDSLKQVPIPNSKFDYIQVEENKGIDDYPVVIVIDPPDENNTYTLRLTVAEAEALQDKLRIYLDGLPRP